MPKLPVVSGEEAVRALERLGFKQIRQRGSHVVLRRGEIGCVVPNHTELAIGTFGHRGCARNLPMMASTWQQLNNWEQNCGQPIKHWSTMPARTV